MTEVGRIGGTAPTVVRRLVHALSLDAGVRRAGILVIAERVTGCLLGTGPDDLPGGLVHEGLHPGTFAGKVATITETVPRERARILIGVRTFVDRVRIPGRDRVAVARRQAREHVSNTQQGISRAEELRVPPESLLDLVPRHGWVSSPTPDAKTAPTRHGPLTIG